MSDNPKSAIDAILQTDAEIDGVRVYPITLARYGLLDLVGSPFTTPGATCREIDVIPSLYIMTQPMKNLKGYNSENIGGLAEKAMEWADEMPIVKTRAIIDEIVRQMRLLSELAPEQTEEHPSKKAPTGGC